MSHLKQAQNSLKNQKENIGELLQQARASFALSIGVVRQIDAKNRTYRVFLLDEDKEVQCLIALDVNLWNMRGKIGIGNYVTVLHKAGISALILDKIANDRLFTRDSNPNNKNNAGINMGCMPGG